MALNAYRYRFYGGDSGAEQAFLLSMYAKGYTAASVMSATDQVLTGKGTTKVGSSTTVVAVNNSATKTTVLTQGTGAAQAGDEFVLTVWGDSLNQTGSAQTYTLDLNLGATSLASSSALSVTTSSSRRKWWLEVNLLVASTTSQNVGGVFSLGAAGTQTWMLASTGLGGSGGFFSTATEDMSTSKDITLAVTMGAANSSLEWRLGGYSLARRR